MKYLIGFNLVYMFLIQEVHYYIYKLSILVVLIIYIKLLFSENVDYSSNLPLEHETYYPWLESTHDDTEYYWFNYQLLNFFYPIYKQVPKFGNRGHDFTEFQTRQRYRFILFELILCKSIVVGIV